MAQDWLADVRRYDANADEAIVAGIVRHCGIALRSRDASLVSFSDSAETDRVRESFCKKKLALTDDDATLDAAIAAVGDRMKGDNFKNRVTVYYLLAQHFGLLPLFAKAPRAKGKAAAAAPAAPPTPAAPPPAPPPAPAPVAAAVAAAPVMAAMATPASASGSSDGGHRNRAVTPASTNDLGVGCLGGLAVLAAILIAALVSVWVKSAVLPEPAPEPAPVVAPAPPPAPAVPDGAGVTAGERNGAPMLTVYFDTGSADVTPDFATVSADLRAYLEANPDASVAISGYNDPSGNAALNAELSKNRAQNVAAALVAQGIAETRTALVKPDDATTTDMTPAEARRVEIIVAQ